MESILTKLAIVRNGEGGSKVDEEGVEIEFHESPESGTADLRNESNDDLLSITTDSVENDDLVSITTDSVENDVEVPNHADDQEGDLEVPNHVDDQENNRSTGNFLKKMSSCRSSRFGKVSKSPHPPHPPHSPHSADTCGSRLSSKGSAEETKAVVEVPSVAEGYDYNNSADVGREALVELLEEAAENVGHHAEDVKPYYIILEEEWVRDLDSLLKLDKETLDRLLPLSLSREVQRLLSEATGLTTKNTRANEEGGKMRRGRSPRSNQKKERKRNVSEAPLKYKRSLSSASQSPIAGQRLTAIREEHHVGQVEEVTTYTNEQYRKKRSPRLNTVKQKKEANSKDSINKSVATARAKFSTRQALEDAIHQRQCVAATCPSDEADTQVRELIHLRLILPFVDELNELMDALHFRKESALKNLNIVKAQNIETEIEEVQALITAEERYIMNTRMSGGTPHSIS